MVVSHMQDMDIIPAFLQVSQATYRARNGVPDMVFIQSLIFPHYLSISLALTSSYSALT